ncbi:MAG: accessory gene regulator ArgB-like protein [Clostridia bacterium]
MIEKLCMFLTNKIRKEMPEIDDERAEVINYGLQLVVGEIPKLFIIFGLAYILGVLKLTLLSFLFIMPYRMVSGGTHLHTHIGCIIATSVFYIGNSVISQYLVWNSSLVKYITVFLIWAFSMVMIKKYAPADTEAVPILRKKERRTKQILSYVIMSITLLIGTIVKNNIISNLLIIGTFLQTITITKFMYKITKNKYGYAEYVKIQQVEN